MHEMRTDLPNWHTKQLCTCGYESVSKCEQWKHQAEKLRALVDDLLAEVADWRAVQRLAFKNDYRTTVQIIIDGRTEATLVRVGAKQYMLPVDRDELLADGR